MSRSFGPAPRICPPRPLAPPTLHRTGKNMFDRSSTIVGLDIGTSTVCVVVGEINEQGTLSDVGLGQAKSRGVGKGEIVDFNHAQEDIRSAIVEAEQMADVEI